MEINSTKRTSCIYFEGFDIMGRKSFLRIIQRMNCYKDNILFVDYFNHREKDVEHSTECSEEKIFLSGQPTQFIDHSPLWKEIDCWINGDFSDENIEQTLQSYAASGIFGEDLYLIFQLNTRILEDPFFQVYMRM